MAELITTPYRDYPAIGQSALKRCHSDPDKYCAQNITKTRPPDEPTKEQLLGQDVEDFLLFGKLASVTVIPDEVLSASKSRAGDKWKQFAAEHPGERLLKRHEYEERNRVCQLIAKNVALHQKARELVLQAPMKKVGIAWSWCDLDLKSELDILHPRAAIVDTKTTKDNSAEGFAREILLYGLDVQGAAYQLAADQLFGTLLPFVLVAIQNEPEYSVETWELSEAFLDLGRRKLEKYCLFYRACKESGEWRSETWGEIWKLEPPTWHVRQLEEWSI